MVATKKARSKLAATTWDSLERLTERRTMAFFRSSRSVINPASVWPLDSNCTMSPTANGFVLRSPFKRIRPPARQPYTAREFHSLTWYQDPVERKIIPLMAPAPS